MLYTYPINGMGISRASAIHCINPERLRVVNSIPAPAIYHQWQQLIVQMLNLQVLNIYL